MARALHGKTTGTLGIVHPAHDVVEPTIRRMAAFENAARQKDFVTITSCTKNDPELEDRALRNLLDRHVDGVVIYATEIGPHKELRRLIEQGVHVVTIDGDGRMNLPCDDISADCIHQGRVQAEHLLSIGRRRIAVINQLPSCHVNDQKIRGMQLALEEAGCEPAFTANINMPIHGSNHTDLSEFVHVEQFVRENARRFDAFAALGDMVAMAAMRTVVRMGLRVPEDIAIIGCGDNIGSRYSIPSLSSVNHDAEKTGTLAFELLHQRISGDQSIDSPRRVMMPAILHARESTLGVSAKDNIPTPQSEARK